MLVFLFDYLWGGAAAAACKMSCEGVIILKRSRKIFFGRKKVGGIVTKRYSISMGRYMGNGYIYLLGVVTLGSELI